MPHKPPDMSEQKLFRSHNLSGIKNNYLASIRFNNIMTTSLKYNPKLISDIYYYTVLKLQNKKIELHYVS